MINQLKETCWDKTVCMCFIACRWYRGKVQAVTSRQVDVFFVDYGETELIDRSDVHPLPAIAYYEQTPFQAIECCVLDIESNEDEWDFTFDSLAPIGTKVFHAEVSILAMFVKVVFTTKRH